MGGIEPKLIFDGEFVRVVGELDPEPEMVDVRGSLFLITREAIERIED
jgi:hypothetical protein